MTPIAPLITHFLRDYLPVERGFSPHTCESYAYAFRLLFTFAAGRLGVTPSALHLEHLDAPLIVAFLTHFEVDRGGSPASRNVRLAAVKAFMRYVEFRHPAALEQARQIRAIPSKRHDHPLVRHLTMDEVNAILDAPDITTRFGLRDRAMLHLCFAAALRVSELVTAQLPDLSLRGTASLRVHGKGRRERCLPLWKQTVADLRAWLAVRGENPAREVFLNATDRPMSRAGFEYILDKHVRTAATACPSLADVRSHLTNSATAAPSPCCRLPETSARWRCGWDTPTCAPPRSTCASIPLTSWRPSKPCSRRNSAAGDSRLPTN